MDLASADVPGDTCLPSLVLGPDQWMVAGVSSLLAEPPSLRFPSSLPDGVRSIPSVLWQQMQGGSKQMGW